MKSCHFCGKTKQTGMQVSHSHRRTLRSWKPNLQRVRVTVKGTPTRIELCTKCLKSGKHLNMV